MKKVFQMVGGIPRWVNKPESEAEARELAAKEGGTGSRLFKLFSPNQFKNQDEASKVILSEKDWNIRGSAVLKVEDILLLKKVVYSDKNWMVRAVAVSRIMDEEILQQVALKDKEPIVRELAVEKLKDLVMVQQIALNDKATNVRRAAAKRLGMI